MPGPRLSTTHHALLCLLSTGPASAYDLVRQTRRSIGHVWPRAESNLYADAKRLAAEGLADASTERVGRRPRTTYAITERGEEHLREWLASSGEAPIFECEALLKLGFAPSTTKDAALAQVEVMAQHSQDRLAFGRALAEGYLAGEASQPERLHINAVMWRYLWEMHSATARWAQWARAEIESWPDTSDRPAGRAAGLEVLRQTLGSAEAQPREGRAAAGPEND
jgi:PadR family transcriptional regulator AphA